MSSREEPLVSIVTPVYNGGAYLRECIESVLSQTYLNFEYIILDNCSADDTLPIAEAYARVDTRVQIVSNDRSLPIIANHNKAFSLISTMSKYCKVVSADDVLFPEFLARAVALAEANPTVGIVGSYQLSGAGPNWRNWRVKWAELPFPDTVFPAREVCRAQMLNGVYVFGTPTSLLYRADLVRKRADFFPGAAVEADTSACYQCLQESDFGFVHQVLSYERIHNLQMSQEARALNAYEPSRLDDLQKYGASWLTTSEIEVRRERIVRDYYHFLAVRALQRTDKEFWAYHKQRLRDAGCDFSYYRLGAAIFWKVFDLMLNPKQTAEKIFRRATNA